jgi:hypothetical protein
MAGDTEGIGGCVVTLGKSLVHIFWRERFVTGKILKLIGRLHGFERLFSFRKVVLGREPAARSMFFPFVLDQSATGKCRRRQGWLVCNSWAAGLHSIAATIRAGQTLCDSLPGIPMNCHPDVPHSS